MMFMQVDLPEPDWPTMATNSPFSIFMLMWSAAFTVENPSLKDIGYVLGVQPFDCTPFYNASLDFADKTVKNFNFLFSGAIFMLDSFVNENLFNQSI